MIAASIAPSAAYDATVCARRLFETRCAVSALDISADSAVAITVITTSTSSKDEPRSSRRLTIAAECR
ncbi:hypothetical protein GCM10009534_65740 [Kribbella sandramycini]